MSSEKKVRIPTLVKTYDGLGFASMYDEWVGMDAVLLRDVLVKEIVGAGEDLSDYEVRVLISAYKWRPSDV